MPDKQLANENPDVVAPGWQVLATAPLPRPTYFPAGVAMGASFLFWGLITTWVVLVVGVALFTAALAGWISELRHEYKSH